jgi:hypothetical protein
MPRKKLVDVKSLMDNNLIQDFMREADIINHAQAAETTPSQADIINHAQATAPTPSSGV